MVEFCCEIGGGGVGGTYNKKMLGLFFALN